MVKSNFSLLHSAELWFVHGSHPSALAFLGVLNLCKVQAKVHQGFEPENRKTGPPNGSEAARKSDFP